MVGGDSQSDSDSAEEEEEERRKCSYLSLSPSLSLKYSDMRSVGGRRGQIGVDGRAGGRTGRDPEIFGHNPRRPSPNRTEEITRDFLSEIVAHHSGRALASRDFAPVLPDDHIYEGTSSI